MARLKTRKKNILFLFLGVLGITALVAEQIHQKAEDRRQLLLTYASSLAAQHIRTFLDERGVDLNLMAHAWKPSPAGRRDAAKTIRYFYDSTPEYQCIKLLGPSGITLEGCSRSPSGVGIGKNGFNTRLRLQTFQRAAANKNNVVLSDILPLNTGVQGLLLARTLGGSPPQGYVYSAVSIKTLFEHCVDPVFYHDMKISLYVEPMDRLKKEHSYARNSFALFGRAFRLEMKPKRPHWPDGPSNATTLTMIFGGVLAGLIAFLAWRAEREKKRAGDNLRRFQTVVETTYDLIWSTDSTGRLTFVSPSVQDVLGFKSEEALGRFAWEFFAPPGREGFSRQIGMLTAGETLHGEIQKYRTKNGGILLLETTMVPLLDEKGKLMGANGATRDITGRHEAEERYRRLVESSQDVVFEVDDGGIIRFVNGTSQTLLGQASSRLTGKLFWGIFSKEEQLRIRRLVEKQMAETGNAEFQTRFLRSPNIERQIHFRFKREDDGGGPESVPSCAFQVVGRDTTAQKQLESQVLQFQKMEAVGKLAGGMAHDFNNLLTVILSAAEEAEEGLPAESIAKKNLSQIRRAGRQAAELTRQVLTFSHRHPVEPSELQLNTVVLDMQVFLKRLLPPGVELQVKTSKDLGRVMADRGQMEQVLINLVLNAKDAMPKGGAIQVTTRNVELTEPLAQGPHLLNQGRWVVLEVKDEGMGIPQENIERIFEPFYTTKETGQGVGLGLSVVYGIVRGHQGGLHVETESGRGTTLRVFLPYFQPMAPLTVPESGGQSILLVEPDEFNRKVLRRLLELMTYPVVTALDASGARELAQRPHWRFDLLLASEDAAPEGLDALHKELQGFQPNLHLVVLERMTPGSPREETRPALCPPYDTDQVAAILNEVLHADA